MKKIVKFFYHCIKCVFAVFATKIYFRNTKVLNHIDTIDYLLESNKSLIRFGDGELLWMSGEQLRSIEKPSEKMGRELVDAINYNNDKFIICINGHTILKNKDIKDKKYYLTYITRYSKNLRRVIPRNKIYGEASISRFYMESQDANNAVFTSFFEKIKLLFKNKKVLIIEGGNTKFGVGNDLLDYAILVKRIICPDKDSYQIKDQILSIINNFVSDFDLVLFILGPTAKLLCVELSKIDDSKQYIDIGSVDTDYMYYLYKKPVGCPIKYKNVFIVDYSLNDGIVFDFNRREYEEQILAKIRCETEVK